MTRSSQAGWFPDPSGEIQERYWDGAIWTRETRPYPPPNEPGAATLASPPPVREAARWFPLLSDSTAMRAAAYRKDSPPDLLEAVYTQATRSVVPGDPYPNFNQDQMHALYGLAYNPSTPRSLFGRLVGDGDPDGDWWRYNLAKESAFMPVMSTALMRRLVDQERDDEVVRGKVAANPNVPQDLMANLASDSAAYVRWSLAGNPNIAHDLLMRFVHEANPQVMGVDEDGDGGGGANPQLDVETLERLAAHASRDIKASVALNMNAPSRLLASFAQDPSPDVRGFVAANARTPVEGLRRLAEDPNRAVVWELSGNPAIPVDVVDTILHRGLEHALGSNPATPVELLVQLLRSGPQDSLTLCGILGNPSLDAGTLRKYVSHREELLRVQVAGNPSSPPDVLETLLTDADESVRYSVMVNPAYWPGQ